MRRDSTEFAFRPPARTERCAGEAELVFGLTGHGATLPSRGPGRQSRFRIGIWLTRRAVFACLLPFAARFVRRSTQNVNTSKLRLILALSRER